MSALETAALETALETTAPDLLDGGACCVPLGSAQLTEAEAADAAHLFKALADPHRIRILNLLATTGAPVCVCELVPALGLAQPTVSFHLKKLADAGLIRRERRGTWAYYTIDPDTMRRVKEVVDIDGAR